MPALKDQYTPAEVIKWLRKFPGNKKFSWFNIGDKPGDECGCLFTRFVRAKTRKTGVVGVGGSYRDKDRDLTFPKPIIIPFHDRFWGLVPSFRGVGKSVTAARAIKILKFLSKA